MSERPILRYPSRRAERPRRGRVLLWLVVALAGLAVAFALGQAVANGPAPPGTQTIDRTVRLVTVTVKG